MLLLGCPKYLKNIGKSVALGQNTDLAVAFKYQ